MRLLFISSTTVGGSGRSQRELAARLVDQGHDVLILVDHLEPRRLIRWVYEQFADASVKLDGRGTHRLIRRLEQLPGRRVRRTLRDGVTHLESTIPENSAMSLIDEFRPDVVVASSLLRLAWRKIRIMCRDRAIPTILYIREQEALNHFEDTAPADAVVANARSLQTAIENRGFTCTYIPSLIELAVTKTESSRRVALFINPIETRGVATLWKLAESLPDIQFVVQESWPLADEQLRAVTDKLAILGNVQFRRVEPAGPRLYGDARVLLVPYRIDNRPRVILEAQANGIPVIVADVPALVEAIGDGGVHVGLDDIEGWCSAIRSLWADEALYERLSQNAVRHSQRPEVDPVAVARSFEAVATRLVRDRSEVDRPCADTADEPSQRAAGNDDPAGAA